MLGKLIVVADGHDDSRIIYSAILRHAGFVVLEARTGAEALEMIPTHLPHAIVSELTLPVLDGRELVRMLKQNPETAHLPVLIVTAYSRPEVRTEVEAHCAAFLIKPCPPNKLLQVVRDVLDEQVAATLV
jgi:CheY-like chemotaxis protein